MDFIIVSFSIAFILTVWYQTDAFFEYIKLLGLRDHFRLQEYLKDQEELDTKWAQDSSIKLLFFDYKSYLKYKHGTSFFVKLIMCPVCLVTWLALFGSLFVGFQYWLALASLSLILYFSISILIRESHR